MSLTLLSYSTSRTKQRARKGAFTHRGVSNGPCSLSLLSSSFTTEALLSLRLASLALISTHSSDSDSNPTPAGFWSSGKTFFSSKNTSSLERRPVVASPAAERALCMKLGLNSPAAGMSPDLDSYLTYSLVKRRERVIGERGSSSGSVFS